MECKRYPIGDYIVDLGSYSCSGCLQKKRDDFSNKIEDSTRHRNCSECRQYFSWGYEAKYYRCAFKKESLNMESDYDIWERTYREQWKECNSHEGMCLHCKEWEHSAQCGPSTNDFLIICNHKKDSNDKKDDDSTLLT